MDKRIAAEKLGALNTASARQMSLLKRSAFVVLASAATLLALAAIQNSEADRAPVGLAFQAGLLTAFATLLGTLPVLYSRALSQRVQDTMLGFGAGVMLAACSFSLILPGLDAAESRGAGPWLAGGIMGGGILAGGGLLFLFDRLMPHQHFIKGVEGRKALRVRRAWLFVGAISLHNLPEGLAIGVAYGGPDVAGAHALATGIGVQNIPEGLVVALSLVGAGYSRLLAAALGGASGLVEPAGAVLGAALIGISAVMLPFGLAFAAGAMLYVISSEIIPESHRQGHEAYATWGLLIGFVLMMLLDTALA